MRVRYIYIYVYIIPGCYSWYQSTWSWSWGSMMIALLWWISGWYAPDKGHELNRPPSKGGAGTKVPKVGKTKVPWMIRHLMFRWYYPKSCRGKLGQQGTAGGLTRQRKYLQLQQSRPELWFLFHRVKLKKERKLGRKSWILRDFRWSFNKYIKLFK